MKRIGILAYGSLMDYPGKEISAATVNPIKVVTPFKVEFARSSSRTRDGAPTLIPVESEGANIKAQILILKEGISEKDAKDMLWRREKHQVGSNKTYTRSAQPNNDTVLIERLENLQDIDVVFYTKIGSNIDPLTPQRLARLAIKSALSEAGTKGLDGLRYLINAKHNGIQTPLMPRYEEEILREVGATNLEDALDILQMKRLKRASKSSLTR